MSEKKKFRYSRRKANQLLTVTSLSFQMDISEKYVTFSKLVKEGKDILYCCRKAALTFAKNVLDK